MALIKCKECGKEVSSGAKSCPYCGISNPGLSAKTAIVTMLLAVGIVYLVFKLVSGSDPVTPPTTIQGISSNITSVQDKDGVLRITLAGKTVLHSKDVVQNASMDAYNISEALVRYFPGALNKDVVFVANAELVDQYGKESMGPIFELQYSTADLKKIAFGNLYHKQMLELAAPVKYLAIAGAKVIVQWCADEDNRNEAKRFCAKNAI